MTMILHQMRHGRQDNHATNHARRAETSKARHSRGHGELRCWLPSGPWGRVGNAYALWFMRLLRGLPHSRLLPKLSPLTGLPCMNLPDMIGLFRLRAVV
jgi:hypothetical protein